MNRFFSAFKAIQRRQIVTMLLAGVLVLFSTACSRPDVVADRLPGNTGPNTPGQSQSYKGGINNFNDDDSSRLNTQAAAKAKALKDKVESRIKQNGINNPNDLADNVRSADPGKQAQRFGDDVRSQAEGVKDSLQKFGDRGAKNLKRNAEDASDSAAKALDKAANTLQDKG